ncbi:MAG TPA: hypothetical protein VH912_00560 [Streptosporangiaceae bacterium]|jgi:hypothetical protein
MDMAPAEKAHQLLIACGARDIAHPGGTLLAHLERVHLLVSQWGARDAVRLAGLCHAFYGTDGFPTALGDVARRSDLERVIGTEAEELVYVYAACDRGFTYPRLTAEPAAIKDRFTGAVLRPSPGLRRDFAEITAANELDIVTVNADLRARYGAELHELFTSWRGLLSDHAQRAVRATLPPPHAGQDRDR